MANIKDVAKHAGVSVSTVSNIINNKETVGEDAYRTVMNAISELNYRPSLLARNMKSNRVKFIGLIVPTLNGVYKDIMDGIQRKLEELEERDYYIIVKTTDDFPTREKKALEAFSNLGVQGIFLVTSFKRNGSQYESVLKAHIPIVFVERAFNHTEYTSVMFDNRSIVRKVYSRLFTNGFSMNDILLITGPTQFSSEQDCVDGAEIAISELSPESSLARFAVSLNEIQSFGDLMPFFSKRPKLKSIVISSDRILDSLVEALRMYGYFDVPIYVLTGDRWADCPLGSNIHYVHRNAILCGRQCAELMLDYLRKPILYENEQLVVPTEQVRICEPVVELRRCEKLRLLLTASPTTSAIQMQVRGFEEQTGIAVECQVFDNQRALYSAIQKSAESRNPDADVFMVDYPWAESLIHANALLPLGPYFEQDADFIDDFLPIAWDTFRSERPGDLFGIPLTIASQVMLYRKDYLDDPQLQRLYFKNFGIHMSIPRTWTEYNYFSRFFTKEFNAESPTEYGTCILGAGPDGLVQEFLPRQWSFSGNIASKREIVIDSVQNIRALSSLKDTYSYSYPNVRSFMENEQIAEFAKGNIAIITTFNSHINSIFADQFSEIADNIGYAPIPGSQSLLGAWMLSVNAYSKSPDSAVDFIRWLSSDRVSINSSIMGSASPKKSAATSEQIKTIYPWNIFQSEIFAKARKREVLHDAAGRMLSIGDVDEIISEGVASVLYENMSVEVSLGIMKEKFSRLMGK
ncbi:MAG: extracellular solute-binding protein [Eubacteriales bacterium]|nr:extracellular solute-binding protein [Eubacteriales bacterium]